MYKGEEEKHKAPEKPTYKLEIEDNDIPENWWDKLPDYEPRVEDAIMIKKASACVKEIMGFDVFALEHKMEARKFRKTCMDLKTQVPRTQVIAPKEITYDTKIDSFIRKDVAY